MPAASDLIKRCITIVNMFMPDGILRKLRKKVSEIKARKPMRTPARKIAKFATSLKKNLKSNLNSKLTGKLTGKLASDLPSNLKKNIKSKLNSKLASDLTHKLKSKPARKPSRNNTSAARRRMYLRRRIAVGTALLLILAIAIFCVISLGKGLAAIGGAFAGHEVNVSRKTVPDPRPVGLTPRCTARDIRLELTAQSQNVPMGGGVEFTERFVYDGNTSCLIDASNINAVLTINDGGSAAQNTHGAKDNNGKVAGKNNDVKNNDGKNDEYLSQAVWRSDVCKDVPLKPLLMSKGDHFEKKIIWNTNATSGDNCIADSDLPKVNRGTYFARIVHKRVPGLRSEPVIINVQ